MLQSSCAVAIERRCFLSAPDTQNCDHNTGDRERPDERRTRNADKRNRDDPEPKNCINPLLPHNRFFRISTSKNDLQTQYPAGEVYLL